jgi:dihydrofolate reductase
MEGGTTFHFVTGGIEEALELAKAAAGSKDIKIGGGVSTVRQYLKAGLIDSIHLASAPVLLGQGESLFDGLDLHALGFSITERKTSEYATHLVLEKASEQGSSLGTGAMIMCATNLLSTSRPCRH